MAKVQIHVSGHDPADWYFELNQDGCTLVSGTVEQSPLMITANRQTWLDLAEKRLAFAGAAMNGRLQYSGDTELLMRLDNEFSGTPDPARLVEPVMSESNTKTAASATPTIGDPETPAARRPTFFDMVQAADSNGTLPPDQRRAAIIAAMRHNLASGASGAMPRGEVQLAVQKALRDLPSDATREQKIAAIRTAIRSVPSASHLAAVLDSRAAGQTAGDHEGLGAGLAGALLEGVLDSLLGGG
jgi:hypothetical protein